MNYSNRGFLIIYLWHCSGNAMKIKLLFTHFSFITYTIYKIIHAPFNIYIKVTKKSFWYICMYQNVHLCKMHMTHCQNSYFSWSWLYSDVFNQILIFSGWIFFFFNWNSRVNVQASWIPNKRKILISSCEALFD